MFLETSALTGSAAARFERVAVELIEGRRPLEGRVRVGLRRAVAEDRLVDDVDDAAAERDVRLDRGGVAERARERVSDAERGRVSGAESDNGDDQAHGVHVGHRRRAVDQRNRKSSW